MVHVYSIIQDDLPSMDNSDLRRGKRRGGFQVFAEGGEPGGRCPRVHRFKNRYGYSPCVSNTRHRACSA